MLCSKPLEKNQKYVLMTKVKEVDTLSKMILSVNKKHNQPFRIDFPVLASTGLTLACFDFPSLPFPSLVPSSYLVLSCLYLCLILSGPWLILSCPYLVLALLPLSFAYLVLFLFSSCRKKHNQPLRMDLLFLFATNSRKKISELGIRWGCRYLPGHKRSRNRDGTYELTCMKNSF
jgi:hypothetical protein